MGCVIYWSLLNRLLMFSNLKLNNLPNPNESHDYVISKMYVDIYNMLEINQSHSVRQT